MDFPHSLVERKAAKRQKCCKNKVKDLTKQIEELKANVVVSQKRLRDQSFSAGNYTPRKLSVPRPQTSNSNRHNNIYSNNTSLKGIPLPPPKFNDISEDLLQYVHCLAKINEE